MDALEVIPLLDGIALPNGLVLLGRAGIKFSKLTSDEFSPKKLSGVFLVAFIFDDVSENGSYLPLALAKSLVLFHGLVEPLLA